MKKVLLKKIVEFIRDYTTFRITDADIEKANNTCSAESIKKMYDFIVNSRFPKKDIVFVKSLLFS